jgi:putative endonuclease
VSAGRRGYLTGAAAEEAALRGYVDDGAELLASRWRCPEGEIDLILRLDETIVFVEVKARRARDDAAAALLPAQLRRIAAAAEHYLALSGASDRPCRLDVVLVDGAGRCERIENAAGFDAW